MAARSHAANTGGVSHSALDSLRLLSVSYPTAPLGELERVALDSGRRDALLRGLDDQGLAATVLLTCHRTELYWVSAGTDDDVRAETGLRAGACGALPAARRARGAEVAQHLFRVASGIESLAIGEAEVLGQVRDMRLAEAPARAAESTRALLSGLIAVALRCGRRVRASTAIGAGAVSIASLAAQWLLDRLERPESRRIVVLGTGSTGLAAARHLNAEGATLLTLINRSVEPARAAAAGLGCAFASIESLPTQLRDADAVIVSVASPQPVLTPELLTAAGRRPARAAPVPGRAPAEDACDRTLVIVDLSLPRAADPALREIPGVTLCDLSSLEETARANHARRALEVPRAEAVIERELQAFARRADLDRIRPRVSSMRGRAERICRAELERALAAGALDEAGLARLTRRLVDRMVAAHAELLREDAELEDAGEYA
jgi:glutamyl-tRNA reductase